MIFFVLTWWIINEFEKRICQSKETSNVIVWEDLQPTDKSANIITK